VSRHPEPTVMHVGVFGELPGGMAQVLNEYLSWDYSEVRVRAMASTQGRGDPWMLLRSLRCVLVMLVFRFSRRRHAFVFHLSSGGSFVREGGLAALARLLCFPVALHLHGSDFAEFSERAPRLIHAVLLLGHRIYVLTEETMDIARAIVGRAAVGRIVKIVNGVAVPERLGAAKESLILFAGEAGPRKGVDVLLDAWSAIRAKHPEWRLVIAGPPRDWEPPPAADDGAVTLLGPITHDEVLRWQARAAVAALPSRQEALPMFLLEAMAHGCAVVTTPVGEVSELVEGCGVLVAVDDPEALADGLHRLLGDPTLVAELADAGRARVRERYSAERVARQLEREWRLLLGVADGRLVAVRGGRRPVP
jgi:glycosyltransferase involved in cell wall biosynthesis